MAIGIDELDDDFEFQNQDPNPNPDGDEGGNGGEGNQPDPDNNDGNGGAEENEGNEGNENNGGDNEDIDNATYAFLKTKGIDDPSKIKFENEDTGEIEEVSWEELSEKDKLGILNTSNVDPDRELEDPEIALINSIRESGLSIDDYVQAIKQSGIEEARKQFEESNPPTQQFEVDNIPDDELYLLDLQHKLGDDATDEELLKALEIEKQNPEFFAKKVNGLRQEYKALEEQQRNLIAEQERQEYEAKFANFQNNVLNEIRSFNKVGNLDIELDVNDMNEIANVILSDDPAGVNYLQKALSSPANLVKVAWFLTKGESAFKDINDYYAQQIKEVSRAQYKRGLEDGKTGKTSSPVSKPHVVKQPSQNNIVKPKSIDDLD